jgi:hypothetical protein
MHHGSARPCARGKSGTGLRPRFYFLFRNVRQRTERCRTAVKNRSTLNNTAQNKLAKGKAMNSIAWIGIILWGVLLTGFGLVSAGPSPQPGAADLAAHDVFFLITGGLLTCMIGFTGLMGFMGWVPGLRKEQKSVA